MALDFLRSAEFRSTLPWLTLGGAAVALLYQQRQLNSHKRQIQALQLHIQKHGTVHKPQLIILMRHGETEANVDAAKYGDKGDPQVELTDTGRLQAKEAGGKIAELVRGRAVATFVSPYVRTRQTAAEVLSQLRSAGITLTMQREDPRLREREFSGTFQRERPDTSDAEQYSRFFWRPPGGESCADVYDRVSSFMTTLWRCFGRHSSVEDGVALIISHGLTVRLLAMRWLNWTPEMFLASWNPGNCGMLVLERQPPDASGRDWYKLTADSLTALGLGGEEADRQLRFRQTLAPHFHHGSVDELEPMS